MFIEGCESVFSCSSSEGDIHGTLALKGIILVANDRNVPVSLYISQSLVEVDEIGHTTWIQVPILGYRRRLPR